MSEVYVVGVYDKAGNMHEQRVFDELKQALACEQYFLNSAVYPTVEGFSVSFGSHILNANYHNNLHENIRGDGIM